MNARAQTIEMTVVTRRKNGTIKEQETVVISTRPDGSLIPIETEN